MDAVDDDEADAFAGRVFEAALGTFETLSIYVGDRLGLYRTLQADAAWEPTAFAEAAGIHPRYAREWLEQQAVAGIVRVDADGRFALPAAHADVLADAASLRTSSPTARIVMAAAARMPEHPVTRSSASCTATACSCACPTA